MRIQSEAEIRLASPVLEIMARPIPRAREVRNLILRDSSRAEMLHGFAIHVRDGLLIRHHANSVARASGDHLAAQPGIFIHVEHVYAQVRYAGRDGLRKRIAPALPG